MKKYYFYIFLLAFVLFGCSNITQISFKGESENWIGEYQANIIGGNQEEGTYTFRFKNGIGKEEIEFSSYEIRIGEYGQSVRRENSYKGLAVFTNTTSCSGCAVTASDKPIKVTIKWNGKSEETFYLEPK